MIYKNLLIGNEKNLSQKIFIWNMMGSTLYSLTSVILMLSVTRVLGMESAGIFQIAFTTSQLMLTIAYYEMRPYQVTDVHDKFEFKEYFTVRIVTCILMIFCSMIFIFIKGYAKEKAIIVFLLCLYKMMDGLADVFEGTFQKGGRLDVAGKSLAFRTIITSIVFMLSVYVTKNLFISTIILVVVSILVFFMFDVSIASNFCEVKLSKNINAIKKLLKECFPFFLASFMSIYVLNAIKYAIDGNLSDTYQSIYGIIFMPSFTISLLSGFILKPLLTTLAESWKERNMIKFKKMVLKLIFCIMAFTLIGLIGAYFLGIPVLSWLYNQDLSGYKIELLILLFSGGISAINTAFYYTLTVMRSTKNILFSYSLATIVALLFANTIVAKWKLIGGATFHLIIMLLLCITFASMTMWNFKRNNNKLTVSQ